MVIQIDFDRLIQVMLEELKKQHPNEVMTMIQELAGMMEEEEIISSKKRFMLLGGGILLADGRDLSKY